ETTPDWRDARSRRQLLSARRNAAGNDYVARQKPGGGAAQRLERTGDPGGRPQQRVGAAEDFAARRFPRSCLQSRWPIALRFRWKSGRDLPIRVERAGGYARRFDRTRCKAKRP